MITILSFNLSYFELFALGSVALLTGMAKTGVHGAGMMSVPMLAAAFGGQLSSGIMLPMLCIADIFGVIYYHRHASWKHLKKLFPWAAIGVIMGTIIGKYVNDDLFKIIMAVIILFSVAIMIWLEKGHKKDVPDYPWFGRVSGTAGGFTSMVGNLAGSVMAIYLLSMRLPKNVYIGTTAWFFMVINWFKIPFHVFAWHTITVHTFLMNLLTTPVILLGAFLGIKIIKVLSEQVYRWFIIGMTLIAAVYMLLM
ncbi:MAG TPA: sulfite exporter TauE/SafE family protein [Cyclobacteriaceae bacterium]|nr:sulfite exporter TauE/SafE family protein [Cyclobacteriaceae bacterium]